MKTLDQILSEFPVETRAEIQARSEELILEEHALRRMRKARKLTQERMAELLGVRQDSISRLEKRSDLLLSTLRSYVEAMGGVLQLTVKFEDEQPIAVPSLLDVEEQAPVFRSSYVNSCWNLAHMVECSVAELAVSANTNSEQDLWGTACNHPVRLVCPTAMPADAGKAFGGILVYRYDPPRQRLGYTWGKADFPGEPADCCW